ncbi:hypothetical protein NL676_007648 [Syzygium grande]|nr:hypothetical protein NL676_007648 [Syzygium grande]
MTMADSLIRGWKLTRGIPGTGWFLADQPRRGLAGLGVTTVDHGDFGTGRAGVCRLRRPTIRGGRTPCSAREASAEAVTVRSAALPWGGLALWGARRSGRENRVGFLVGPGSRVMAG